MVKRVAVAMSAGLLVFGVSSCASGDSQAQVDAFCSQVEQLVVKANKLAEKPADEKLGKEITAAGQALVEQVPGLVATIAGNPTLAPRLQECASQLQNIGSKKAK